jgi:MFS family permease
MLSNLPTPLYTYWQQSIGFGESKITIIFVSYIVGLILALLIAGQLSVVYGHKPMLIIAIITALSACLLFGVASSVFILIISRFLSGLAIGIIVSVGMSAVMLQGIGKLNRLASLAASTAMVIGAGSGPLLSGLLVEVLFQPVVPIFLLEFLILCTTIPIILNLPTKENQGVKEKWSLRLPTISKHHILGLSFGIAIFAPGITSTSFMLSLSPSLLNEVLGISSAFIAGLTVCIMFLFATGIQFFVNRQSLKTIFLLGAGAILFSMVSIVLGVHFSNIVFIFAAGIFAGMGQGLGQLGGLTYINHNISAEKRAEANALLNIGGYVPAALLPVSTGYFIDVTSVQIGSIAFSIVLIIITLYSTFHIVKYLK